MITFKSDKVETEADIRLTDDAPQRTVFQLWPWLFVLLVVLLMVFVRYRLLDLPLERGEGEYAYAGQLILQGTSPYQLVWSANLPGSYFACALGMAAFGQTAAGLHATLIVANSLTIILLFLLGRRLFGIAAGLAACAVYGILSASPAVLGLATHANHFVILFAVWGALLLWKAEEFYRWHAMFFSGLMFGLAFVMKQEGICFCLFGAAIVFWHAVLTGTVFRPIFFQKLFFLGVGMALPFLAVCLYLDQAGVLGKFWFRVFDYARTCVTENSFQDGLQNFRHYIDKNWPIYFPFAGFVVVSLPFVFRDRAHRGQIIFAGAFLFFSAIGTAIDFDFREHYFILILPALAILVGLAIVSLQFTTENQAFKAVPPLICLLILGWSIFQQRQFFLRLSTNEVSRTIYAGDAPFADMPAVGGYIRGHSGPAATLAVVGSEPEIYFYAQRRPATGCLYTYPLMESQPDAAQMRAEMINEIETNNPEFLVYVSNPASWRTRPGSDRSILDWFTKYSGKFYDRVALLDQVKPDKTVFISGKQIINYHLTGPDYVGIFRRKAAAN
jgi:hypothetical protein